MQRLVDRVLATVVPIVDWIFSFWPVRGIAIVFDRYGKVGGGIFAWGLANRALFALLPGLLLIVSIIGFVVRDPELQQEILDAIVELAPPLQGLITDSVEVLANGAAAFGIIGLVTLIWGASGFFQALEVAFAVLLGEERRRDPVSRAVIGILGVVAILAVLTATVVAASFAWPWLEDLLKPVIDLAPIRLLAPALAGVFVSLALTVAYLAIPMRRPSLGAAWLPAVAGGIAIAALTEVVAFLGPRLVGSAAFYGAIAAVFLMLIWLQFAVQVVLVGMVWTGLRSFGWPSRDEVSWPAGNLNRPTFGQGQEGQDPG